MKIYHFVFIFLIFFLATCMKTDINIGRMEEIQNEKKELTESLYSATSDAINYITTGGKYGTNSIDKSELLNTFFSSLYSSMGIISDPNAQAEIALYIPVILLCDSDGYYVYYFDEYKDGGGNTFSERVWTEKMPYDYKDDSFVYRFTLTDTVDVFDINHLITGNERDFIETDYHDFTTDELYRSFREAHSDHFLMNKDAFEQTRKTAIINQLEKVLTYYTNRHNSIARQNGITYNFAFPAGQKEEWASYMDDVNLVVVFQGYPYANGKDYTFNKIASSGANILKKPVYYVEQKSWYYLAHKAGCPKLVNNDMVLEETFHSLEDCAKMGAFCDECIDNGPRVPVLK